MNDLSLCAVLSINDLSLCAAAPLCRARKGLLQRLRRTDVAGARTDRKNEDALPL